MRVLDLFSGIAGFSLGLERVGMETVAFCENDKNCRELLSKHFPLTPIFPDVKTLKASDIPEGVDVICGGFPCQDVSYSGLQKGILEGERSGLWKQYARIISEVRPKYVVIENVENLIKNGIGVVLNDLYQIGYDAEWHCITAESVGYPHQRDRVFIISYPSRSGQYGNFRLSGQVHTDSEWEGEETHTEGQECESQLIPICPILSPGAFEELRSSYSNEFHAVSSVRRVVDGIPTKLDETRRKAAIKQLGNAIVPRIAEIVGRAILRDAIIQEERKKSLQLVQA